jgi:iron complex outermembrane recepter protein
MLFKQQWRLYCLVVGLLASEASLAQSVAVLSTAIPAQSLSQALVELSRQTGLQFVYVSELASGRTSSGAPAGLSASAALARLLDGTGLGFEILNERTVRLFALVAAPPAAALPVAAVPMEVSPDAAPRAMLEEILVSATKRELPLQAVPISADVLTAGLMEKRGVKNVGDIAARTPGVEFDAVSSFGPGIRTNMSIRGVNSNVGTSTTGIYIDDAPIQARNYNFGNPYPVTFDLARVEVLRGPQGTLFGAGAEGGAIRFIRREPSLSKLTGLVQLEAAQTQYGQIGYEAGAAVDGPLVPDVIGVRASGWYRADVGYVDRVDPFTGSTVDGNANRSVSKSATTALTYAPTRDLQATAALTYQAIDLHDSPVFYTDLSRPADGVLRNGKLLQQSATDHFYLASVKFADHLAFADLTAVISYFDREAGGVADSTNFAGSVFFRGFGSALGSSFPISYANAVPTTLGLEHTVLSAEARLASADSNARLTWLAGVFYSRASEEDTQTTIAPAVSSQASLYTDEVNTDTQLAAFGQADFKVGERLKITAGLRIAETKNDYTQRAGGYAYNGAAYFSGSAADELPVTPRFGLSYQSAAADLYYVTVSKGYRIGGVNVASAADCLESIPNSYSSDSLWSYELGAKKALAGGAVQIDASVFHIDWRNVQQSGIIASCGFSYVVNSGSVISNGFDLAMQAQATDRLRVALAMGYTDAYFNSTVTRRGLVIVDKGTAVGGLPRVPAPWTVRASAEYRVLIAGQFVGHMSAEDVFHSHNSGPFTEADPTSSNYWPSLRPDPSTNMLNLRAGLSLAKFAVTLFINNALNSQPAMQRLSDVPASKLYYASTFQPRTFGLNFTWRAGVAMDR